jgi:hypothetical protein
MIKVEKKFVGNGFFRWTFTCWCAEENHPLCEMSFIAKSPKQCRDSINSYFGKILEIKSLRLFVD